MIKEIIAIVKVLADTAKSFNAIASTARKNNNNLELLKIYFIIKDVQEDGCKLLDFAPPDPVDFISIASSEALDMRLSTWNAVLRRQGARLQEIQNYISGRSDLAIINPQAQKRIAVIIGAKRGRVFSLFNLGAGLFFRAVLPIQESPESLRDLVMKTLTLQENEDLNITKIKLELNELEDVLEEYRKLILLLMSNEDISLLSEKARKETRKF
ncbi:hypothetical protein GHO25_04210 [Pseudomonas sp. FSL R10-1350]|uniref:hypothetical protein n=1 Tax=Pseudomonas sp. FSL R10-1350 TaxID=2662197 RepID=UPI0012974576|nr:hypothetical protein [Pseudomonas sp. FSL R10-1350]MQU62331.1 hypothetical protein [Pseudomonas sp. FSL R10-1350]